MLGVDWELGLPVVTYLGQEGGFAVESWATLLRGDRLRGVQHTCSYCNGSAPNARFDKASIVLTGHMLCCVISLLWPSNERPMSLLMKVMLVTCNSLPS